MESKYVIALLAATLPCLALAQDAGKYQCSYGDLQRRVEIFTEPGASVPCEVHYYKDTEAPGEHQVLWSASNDASYCQQKAEAFVAKLEGWGWDCGQGGEPAPAAEPEAEPAPEPAMDEPEAEEPVQDDTDVLSPGEPATS